MISNPIQDIARVCTSCGADTTGGDVDGGDAPCHVCGGSCRVTRLDGEPGPGRVLGGKYILLRWLGRGGFGAVFVARDPLLARDVAIKVLHLSSDNADALKRFYAEARNTSALSHPHNVKVFDFGHTADGLVYIVMELVPGKQLTRSVGALPAETAVDLLDQIARALGDAHALGLVHRDLKPDNILVTEVDGRAFAKVLDYGISRFEHSATRLTGEGRFVGTPGYASPEQVLGNAADRRSDIYCFGLVAYELIAGEAAFDAESPIGLAMKQIHESPPPLADRAPHASEALVTLIERCLRKAPSERPDDMAAVSNALRSVPEFGRRQAGGGPTVDVPSASGSLPSVGTTETHADVSLTPYTSSDVFSDTTAHESRIQGTPTAAARTVSFSEDQADAPTERGDALGESAADTRGTPGVGRTASSDTLASATLATDMTPPSADAASSLGAAGLGRGVAGPSRPRNTATDSITLRVPRRGARSIGIAAAAAVAVAVALVAFSSRSADDEAPAAPAVEGGDSVANAGPERAEAANPTPVPDEEVDVRAAQAGAMSGAATRAVDVRGRATSVAAAVATAIAAEAAPEPVEPPAGADDDQRDRRRRAARRAEAQRAERERAEAEQTPPGDDDETRDAIRDMLAEPPDEVRDAIRDLLDDES